MSGNLGGTFDMILDEIVSVIVQQELIVFLLHRFKGPNQTLLMSLCCVVGQDPQIASLGTQV